MVLPDVPAACGVEPGGVTADSCGSLGAGMRGTGWLAPSGGGATVVVPGMGELPGGITGTGPVPGGSVAGYPAVASAGCLPAVRAFRRRLPPAFRRRRLWRAFR